MPGIDFNQLRHEITMEQVLDLLGFECYSSSSGSVVRILPVARIRAKASTGILGERGDELLLLPQVR